MKIIIIANNTSAFNELMNDYKIDVINYNEFCNERSTPETWDSYNDYYCHLLCCRIRTESEHSKTLLLVSNDLEHKALLVFHALIEINKNIAVALFYNEIPEDLRLIDDNGLFKNYFIKQYKLSLIKEKIENSTIDSIYNNFISEFNFLDLIENYTYPKKFDHHQATNEWGAISLLNNFGMSLPENKSQVNYPKTLFFLIKENEFKSSAKKDNLTKNEEDALSRFENNKKYYKEILLIDDNAHKGWEFAIKQIFSFSNVTPILNRSDLYVGNKLIDLSKFDLIFLDLRIPYDKNSTPNINVGYSILEEIKNIEKYPNIPIVVFTASQKATTLDNVLEKGADEMCIKDSPLINRKESYKNYIEFIKSINRATDKYKILNPYWNTIKEIRKNYLLEIDENMPGKKFRSRANERLKMFYGLIKKSFEQWKYDEDNFFYSASELAFMTLWSLLNDIQEAYFEKKDETPITYLKNKSCEIVLNHPNSKNQITPLNGRNWKIRNQNDYLQYCIFDFDFDQNNNIKLNNGMYKLKVISTKSSIVLKDGTYELGDSDRDCSRELSNQIAFLLLKKSKLCVNSQSYLLNLFKLNKIRNNLYLIHGETENDFYNDTLQNKNKIDIDMHFDSGGHIEKLFNLVAYLLTGKQISVNFNTINK